MSEPRRSGLRPALLAATALAALAFTPAARAEGSVSFLASPPMPGQAQYEAASRTLADQINQPITGAGTLPVVEGVEAPPSLEALQAARPGDQVGDGLETGRAEVLRQAATIYGAQGGLAGRSFAINEMLRRYEAQLTATYDFRPLVLSVGGGQTLMRPPIVSEAQMAFALGENGQVARETSCIFEITREAQLTSAPPDWRSYLVRSWGTPARPADAALPRTR
ncbi:MAG: conjugal transfer protein TraI, partial [Azospirillum brasilense]